MAEESEEPDTPAPATEPPGASHGFLWELFGCLIPFLVAVAFLLVVMWGYRWVFGQSRPVPVEAGEVRALELLGGDGKEHVGRRCRVYPDWVAVEADGAVVLIPRERVQSLRVAP